METKAMQLFSGCYAAGLAVSCTWGWTECTHPPGAAAAAAEEEGKEGEEKKLLVQTLEPVELHRSSC